MSIVSEKDGRLTNVECRFPSVGFAQVALLDRIYEAHAYCVASRDAIMFEDNNPNPSLIIF